MVENEAVNVENAAEEKQTENTDIGTEGDADANGAKSLHRIIQAVTPLRDIPMRSEVKSSGRRC